MEKRLQHINGDTVLEITEEKTVKTRLSEKELLRKQDYLETSITKFQAELDDTSAKLSELYAERDKA